MYDLTIPRRIRSRRESRQLAAYELANLALISPSYLSLIENGLKLPSEDVAIRLAEALGDDPELYRAWAEAGDDPDLGSRVQRLERMREVRSPSPTLAAARRRAPSREEKTFKMLRRAGREVKDTLADDASSYDETPEQIEQSDSLNVPFLPDGADPNDRWTKAGIAEDSIQLDPQLLPETGKDLFAYRATSQTIERVRDLISPGDVVVLAANPESIDPSAIYAVRFHGRVVLSRLVYHEPLLLLTAADPREEPLSVAIGSARRLSRALAGVVVAMIRTWAKPEKDEGSPAQLSLGREGRLEDGNIVRDCEWKENYGWRPIQRAEDMDYLDEHAGAKIRFRLIRDGRVKFVLEMTPEEWREALGDYFDGSGWRRNGYIVAITKRVKGEYTEEFQDRWGQYIRQPDSPNL